MKDNSQWKYPINIKRISTSPGPHQNVLSFVVLIIAILAGVR